MKINTSEFLVDNKILEANENEVIYDLPRQRIEETWDKLSAFYIQKSLNENETEIIENEFYLDLGNSRVENETAVTTYDLVTKNIIKKYECKEPKEARSNIKKYILGEILSIFRKGIDELKQNIEEEQKFYEEMREINNEIRIFENSIQIATDQYKYIDFEQFIEMKKDKSKIGLFCTIKLNGLELKGFHSIAHLKSIPDCKSLEKSYSKNGIEISLKNEYSDLKNDAITSFINEIYSGKKIEDLVPMISVLLSRYFLSQLIVNSSKKTIIQTDKYKLADGLSAIFYCLTDKCVFKVVREEYDFVLFCNGKQIKIRNRD